MPAPSPRTAPPEPGPPCRVPLVEDDRTIATNLYDYLSTRGFEVDLAHDGVVVLHQIGNHGPAYFRRYAPGVAHWKSACERDELRECSREAIVNAYDNALLPMLWWIPEGTASRLGIDLACLRRRALEPAGHDELYHAVIGLLDVHTPRYRTSRDVFAGCRAG